MFKSISKIFIIIVLMIHGFSSNSSADQSSYDYFLIGRYYAMIRDFSTAEVFLQKAVEISPEDTDNLILLANNYIAQQKIDEALKLIETS